MRTRIIPILLMDEGSLIKTVQFSFSHYIGDPINTVRIFNEFEVDEIIVLDIGASKKGQAPDFELISEIASECFMPLCYGGGITTLEDAKKIFDCGAEKISLNSSALSNPKLISEIANFAGGQSVVAAVDVKSNSFLERQPCFLTLDKALNSKNLFPWCKQLEDFGAGELLLTSVNLEGTWQGFDFDLGKQISTELNIPIIIHGGAGKIKDITEIIDLTNVSAVGLGSMLIFYKKDQGVLVNMPSELKQFMDDL